MPSVIWALILACSAGLSWLVSVPWQPPIGCRGAVRTQPGVQVHGAAGFQCTSSPPSRLYYCVQESGCLYPKGKPEEGADTGPLPAPQKLPEHSLAHKKNGLINCDVFFQLHGNIRKSSSINKSKTWMFQINWNSEKVHIRRKGLPKWVELYCLILDNCEVADIIPSLSGEECSLRQLPY